MHVKYDDFEEVILHVLYFLHHHQKMQGHPAHFHQ